MNLHFICLYPPILTIVIVYINSADLHDQVLRAEGDRVQLRVHPGLGEPVHSGRLGGLPRAVPRLHHQGNALQQLCRPGESVYLGFRRSGFGVRVFSTQPM